MKLPTKYKAPKYKTMNKKPLTEEFEKLLKAYTNLHNWAKTCHINCDKYKQDTIDATNESSEFHQTAVHYEAEAKKYYAMYVEHAESDEQSYKKIVKLTDELKKMRQLKLELQLELADAKNTWFAKLSNKFKSAKDAIKNAWTKAGDFIKGVFTKKKA